MFVNELEAVESRNHEWRHYHIQTQLPDGRPSLMVDPSSVGNLCGDEWVKAVAKEAAKNNWTPKYTKGNRPLKVSGVGNGSQACIYDCQLPAAFRRMQREHDEKEGNKGNLSIPTVTNSKLPRLLGLGALRKNGPYWTWPHSRYTLLDMVTTI